MCEHTHGPLDDMGTDKHRPSGGFVKGDIVYLSIFCASFFLQDLVRVGEHIDVVEHADGAERRKGWMLFSRYADSEKPTTVFTRISVGTFLKWVDGWVLRKDVVLGWLKANSGPGLDRDQVNEGECGE